MHPRVPLPRETRAEQIRRLAQVNPIAKIIDALVSRMVKNLHIGNAPFRRALYRVAMRLSFWRYRLVNRIEVQGTSHIPRDGAIFYTNHFGKNDVSIFLTLFHIITGVPIAGFADTGPTYLGDILQYYFDLIQRRGSGDQIVERMVRVILEKNRNFVIWPEGSSSGTQQVMTPFTGFVKAYATLNASRDIIPFLPVFFQGAECYPWHGALKAQKIIVSFFKPIFLPRAWLLPPEQRRKSPREIANILMMILARANGQTELATNYLLEYRRQHSVVDCWKKKSTKK